MKTLTLDGTKEHSLHTALRLVIQNDTDSLAGFQRALEHYTRQSDKVSMAEMQLGIDAVQVRITDCKAMVATIMGVI